MSKLSKRQKAMQGKVDHNRSYAVADALKLAKDFATAKFDESIDVAVSLGIDPRKSDQLVRGSVVLPAGTGKTVRVAVFAQGEKAEVAKAAGADIVGFEDLAADIKAGALSVCPDLPVRVYEDRESLTRDLLSEIRENDILLVKGSHAFEMGKVADAVMTKAAETEMTKQADANEGIILSGKASL